MRTCKCNSNPARQCLIIDPFTKLNDLPEWDPQKCTQENAEQHQESKPKMTTDKIVFRKATSLDNRHRYKRSSQQFVAHRNFQTRFITQVPREVLDFLYEISLKTFASLGGRF